MSERPDREWTLRRLAEFGEKSAFVDRGAPRNFRELCEATAALRKRVRELLDGADVVSIEADYGLLSVAALLALHAERKIAVPIATRVPEEIASRLDACPVQGRIRVDGDQAQIERASGSAGGHRLFDDLKSKGRSGLVLFSSGSTGVPKAMVHDLDRLVDQFHGRSEKDLTFIAMLLFDHIGGVNTLLNSLTTGACLVLPESRQPERIAELVEKHRIRVLPTTPTFLNLLLLSGVHRERDLSSLRMVTYGTEKMPPALLEKLHQAFPRVRFMQTFGTSETGIAKTSSKSSSSTLMKIDDENLQYKIVDGELFLKSATQVLGYLNQPMDNFTEDGWFRTGDRAVETEDGYVQILGRINKLINVGGEKVFPEEVENALLEVSGVDDATVYGEPNPIMGQMVCAKIVSTPGVDQADLKARIKAHCRERLERYKIPARIAFVDKLDVSARLKKARG